MEAAEQGRKKHLDMAVERYKRASELKSSYQKTLDPSKHAADIARQQQLQDEAFADMMKYKK